MTNNDITILERKTNESLDLINQYKDQIAQVNKGREGGRGRGGGERGSRESIKGSIGGGEEIGGEDE